MIIVDEARIAKRIERFSRAILGTQISRIHHCSSLFEGLDYLDHHPVDLLLLDLNLNGADGFEVLKNVVSGAFHTIIVSAYKEKAITAFEFGVLDFVPKPFDKSRLQMAFDRMGEGKKAKQAVKFLAVRKKENILLVDVQDIRYIQGAGIYTEIHLTDGRKEIHDKSLEKLPQLLPASFERIHKSYLVDMRGVREIIVQSGSKYSLVLKNGETLPIGRSRYKQLKAKWG